VSPKVHVRVRDDAHARIAWAVASLPQLAPVGMIGRRPPESWRKLVHRSKASGDADIIVDPNSGDRGIVVVAGDSRRPGITHASPQGLARALASQIGGDAEAVWTVDGRPHRIGHAWRFPAPVGDVRGGAGAVPASGAFAAVGGFGQGRTIVCIDDRPFMQAICMAAGAAIASTDLSEPTPVWERAAAYVEACEKLGLVFAESISS
jgi:hypothetical protein